jgi:hypothetical protein
MFFLFAIFGVGIFAVILSRSCGSAGTSGLAGRLAAWPEKIPLSPFIIFAATGLVLSVFVHVLAFFAVTLPIKDAVFALHVGIFVIWIPVVALNQGRGRNHVFNQGPKWMQRALTIVFIYAMASFIYFIATAPRDKKSTAGKPAPASVVRGFSGHWILFYSAGLAALWNARVARRAIPPVRPPIKVEQL